MKFTRISDGENIASVSAGGKLQDELVDALYERIRYCEQY